MIKNKRDMKRDMPLFVFLIIYISKYVERLHFGKTRDMKTIVVHKDNKKPGAVRTRKCKEGHSGIVHAHH